MLQGFLKCWIYRIWQGECNEEDTFPEVGGNILGEPEPSQVYCRCLNITWLENPMEHSYKC